MLQAGNLRYFKFLSPIGWGRTGDLRLPAPPWGPITSTNNFEGDPGQLDGGSSVLVSNFDPYPNYPELYKVIEMGIRQLKAHKSSYNPVFLLFLLHKSDHGRPPPPKKNHLSRDQNPDSCYTMYVCMYVHTYLSTHPFQPTPEAIVEVRLGEARWLMNGQRHDVPAPRSPVPGAPWSEPKRHPHQ